MKKAFLLSICWFFVTISTSADVEILHIASLDVPLEVKPHLTSPRGHASAEPERIQPVDVGIYVVGNVTGSPTNPGSASMSVDLINVVGHSHTNALPKSKWGTFNPASGPLQLIQQYPSGRAYFSFETKYTRPEVAGVYEITGKVGGKSLTLDMRVKVYGLVNLRDYNASWELIGKTAKHKQGTNHYVASASIAQVLMSITTRWRAYWDALPAAEKAEYPKTAKDEDGNLVPRNTLMINDCSLEWGGLFDIEGQWIPSHYTHRDGNDTDIRTNGGIPMNGTHREAFDAIVDEEDPNSTAAVNPEGNHLHIDWDGWFR